MMPVIAINITSRQSPAAPTRERSKHKRIYTAEKTDNQPHKHRQAINQNSHQHNVTNPSDTHICLSCGILQSRSTSCCLNTVVKLTSIFSGSGFDCENFKINHLFSNSYTKTLAQVPLTMECLSEVVNNQQRIKLYSLKSYSITNISRTENNTIGRAPMLYEIPISECIYILIPNHLPRLYVPKYGVIQLDARNSLILPTREHVTINNDTKNIVV
jgi:hypothetical protein